MKSYSFRLKWLNIIKAAAMITSISINARNRLNITLLMAVNHEEVLKKCTNPHITYISDKTNTSL